MSSASQFRLARLAEAAAKKSDDPTRHKCFVSYHTADEDEIAEFINAFGHVFIPRVIGVSEEDDFIESNDTGYVMDEIRERYLTDSTVTIVLVGKCTWTRRFVDWEIYSTLRNDAKNRRSGLMGISLPSAADYSGKRAPVRLNDNISGSDGDDGYARWWKYPQSADALRSRIETVYGYRTTRANLIDNTRSRKTYDASC